LRKYINRWRNGTSSGGGAWTADACPWRVGDVDDGWRFE
jgi:hypothetical protein